jgi:hypothetical protein
VGRRLQHGIDRALFHDALVPHHGQPIGHVFMQASQQD